MNRSWQRIGLLACATAAAGVTLATALPEADASRRASLAENRLVEDRNDVYLFPQLSVGYANLLALDYGAVAGSGSGLLLLGDGMMAFGAGIYRGDLLDNNLFPYSFGHDNLGNIDNLLGYPQPHTIVDLFGAMDLGAGMVGARLSLGSGGARVTFPDEDNVDVSSSETQNVVGLTLGYSMAGDLRLDTGLNILYVGGRSVDEDEVDDHANLIRAGVTARGYLALAPTLDLGFLADIHFTNIGATTILRTEIDDTVQVDEFSFRGDALELFGGVGPVYTIDEATTIAAYAVLGHVRITDAYQTEGDEDFEADRVLRSFGRATFLPGLHVAADIQLLEWLYFRTGAQYLYGFSTDVQEINVADDPDDFDVATVRGTERGSQFGWRAGIGIVVGDFAFDGVFQSGFLLNGPDFLGGAGGGMFTMVSASYSF